MSGFADIDDAQFQTFAKRVGNKVQARETVRQVGDAMKQLAVESQRKVTARTPVGKPPYGTGNLRRNWNVSGMSYGAGGFSFTLENNTEYAPFVENGHRTRGGGGWVEGRFFLKKTVVEIQGEFPTYWQGKFDNALRGLLD